MNGIMRLGFFVALAFSCGRIGMLIILGSQVAIPF